MGKCYIEIDKNLPELLYEDVRDGKGNFIHTTYHNKPRIKSVWKQMSKNVSRTVRELLIQHPELIPVFAEFIEANKEDFPDTLTFGNSSITKNV